MLVEDWLGLKNQLPIDIWNKKYRASENETFEEWLDRVSGNDPNVKALIREKKFLFGGRVLANRGLSSNKKVSLNNCYVLESPSDDLTSIYDTAKYMARTFSAGGGVGIDLSKLSPEGAHINNAAKTTSGAVSFGDIYDTTTSLIGAQGRRSALMLSMSCDNPDIEKFITVKSDLNKLTKANLSVMASDAFMQAVIDEEDYELSFTRETGETISKTVNAKEVFNKLVENNWGYGEPGLLFWDRVKNWNMLSEHPDFEFAGINPCLAPDTVILTNKGYVRIDSVENQLTTVWNGYEWSDVVPQITGYNQDLMLVTFSDGSELKCTPYHIFVLNDSSRVEAKNLQIGQKLIKYSFPIIEGNIDYDSTIMYTRGFYCGDGCYNIEKDWPEIYLYGKKQKLINKLATVNIRVENKRTWVKLDKTSEYNKDFVPDVDCSIKSRLDWLAGIIDSDGSRNGPDNSITISSINKNFLMNIKLLLNTLGVNATVSIMKKACAKNMPDGRGGEKKYNCKDCYRLCISAISVKKLLDIGLTLYRVNVNPQPNRDASRFIKVVSLKKLEDKEEKVYCFNEPKNHTGCFNGIVTGQCGEMPLPAYGACCLGSINLLAYVVKDKSGKYHFDWDAFKNDIPTVVQAMNNVLDEGIPMHPLKEQSETVAKWRQIGIGVLGFASALMRLGVKYGSKESLVFADTVANELLDQSVIASALLAKEYGPYPAYNFDHIPNSKFYQLMLSDKSKRMIEKYGLRNSQLLSIAPTGSLSALLSCSGGIEPLFAISYNRRTESLHGESVSYTLYDTIVKQIMDELNITDEKDLPDYVITSAEIDPISRVTMQATWQRYIDASISSTVNLPKTATVNDVRNIYIEAWKQGLKGITVYRSSCAREGILTTDSKEEVKEDIPEYGLKRGTWKKKAPDTKYEEVKVKTACGQLIIMIGYSELEKTIQDLFVIRSGNGGCERTIQDLVISISAVIRLGGKLENIEKAFDGVGTCTNFATVRAKGLKVLSQGNNCGDAILRTIKNFCIQKQKVIVENSEYKITSIDSKLACPECNEEMMPSGGCVSCPHCGYSKCS